jgi:hypothetical protein
MKKPYTLESVALTTLKKGQIFYSHKMDKDLTAIASYYKKKIKTERMFIINPQKTTIEKLTKITIL